MRVESPSRCFLPSFLFFVLTCGCLPPTVHFPGRASLSSRKSKATRFPSLGSFDREERISFLLRGERWIGVFSSPGDSGVPFPRSGGVSSSSWLWYLDREEARYMSCSATTLINYVDWKAERSDDVANTICEICCYSSFSNKNKCDKIGVYEWNWQKTGVDRFVILIDIKSHVFHPSTDRRNKRDLFPVLGNPRNSVIIPKDLPAHRRHQYPRWKSRKRETFGFGITSAAKVAAGKGGVLTVRSFEYRIQIMRR